MSPVVEHHYRYPQASARTPGNLHLATSGGAATQRPHFFDGRLLRPDETARQLLTLMSIVQSRFHIPAATRSRMGLQWDPVVTAGAQRLRFEAFSACCGVHGRLDLSPGAVDATHFGRGTTNVDFNPPMLHALAGIGPSETVRLRVGQDDLTVQTSAQTVVERRVQLPLRWLRSFVEVQSIQSRMRRVFSVSGPIASRFFRSLLRVQTHRHETWIVPSARGLRLSQTSPTGTALRVGGLKRLRLLEGLVPRTRQVSGWTDEQTGASGWVLDFDAARFQLTLSPEIWRGFSGEGQALEDLASPDGLAAVARVRAHLTWQAEVDPTALATAAEVDPPTADRALTVLGSRGLVGFDLAASRWFHRELPFDLTTIEQLHPRLRAARRLCADGAVVVKSHDIEQVRARVHRSDAIYDVQLHEGGWRCTCRWFGRHGQQRGPCKHVLAVQLTTERTG